MAVITCATRPSPRTLAAFAKTPIFVARLRSFAYNLASADIGRRLVVLVGIREANLNLAAISHLSEGEDMLSWRQCITKVGALCFALTLVSPSVAASGTSIGQPGVVIFWNAAKCLGGYRSDFYSAHCESGPAAAILDFNTRIQFYCVNTEAVDIRWAIPNWSPTDPKRGSPTPPSQVDWHLECWKQPLEFDVEPNTTILAPQYNQSPPPNNYMTMNVIVLYDATKPTIKTCLIPLFPQFPVVSACADAEIRS